MAAAAAMLAQAQPASSPVPMAKPAASPVFAIRGFKVTGDNPLSESETAAILAPFQRSDATIETLQQATAALEKALRDRGYGLHRVALPPQEVGTTVTLNVVKFTIARVNIEGRKIYDEANVRRAVPELREGATPNFKKLAVQTAIANENPNKQIQVGIRESDQPDQIESTITVKEEKPWNIAASLSNAGTSSTGRDRFTIAATHTNLWNLDHQFVGAYTTSLERPEDVKQIGLTYKVPLYEIGGVVSATYTHSDVVGNFGTFTSTGAGHTLGATYTQYLQPQGGRRSYVTVGLEDKVFNATQISGLAVGVDRRSRPLTLGYNARTEADKYVFAYDMAFAANLGSGSGNDLASYRQEDTRITTIHWKAVRGGVSYYAPVGSSGWTWSARGNYQYSPDVLISGEQFGLGGLGSVRGTSVDRPITGDSGVLGTFELTTPDLMTGLRVLGFMDLGWLSNNKSDPSRGKFSSDHLASAGLGLRYVHDPFALNVDYGRIVEGSRVPLTINGSAPKRGDDRVYLNLSVRF